MTTNSAVAPSPQVGVIRTAVENGLSWLFDYETTLAAGATVYIGFKVGSNTCAIESRSGSSTKDDTIFALYEDGTYSGGADFALSNRNRYYATRTDLSPLAECKSGVTLGTLGNLVSRARLLSSMTGASFAEGDSEEASTILLKAGATHIVSITNGAVTPAVVNLSAHLRRDAFTFIP